MVAKICFLKKLKTKKTCLWIIDYSQNEIYVVVFDWVNSKLYEIYFSNHNINIKVHFMPISYAGVQLNQAYK